MINLKKINRVNLLHICLKVFIIYLLTIFIYFIVSVDSSSDQNIDLLTNVSLGNIEEVQALLSSSTTNDLEDALLVAMQNGDQEIVKLLLEHDVTFKKIQEGPLNAIDALIYNNDRKTISNIIEEIDLKHYTNGLGYHIWRGINDYIKLQQTLKSQPTLKSYPYWKLRIKKTKRAYEVSKYLASELASTGNLATAINLVCSSTYSNTNMSMLLPHINHLIRSSENLIPEMVVSCVNRGGKVNGNVVRLIISDKKMITKNIDASILDENYNRSRSIYIKSKVSLFDLSREPNNDNYIQHYFSSLTKDTSLKDKLGNYTTLNQHNANQKNQEGATQLMLSMLLKLHFYDAEDMRLQDFKARISSLKNFNLDANDVDRFGKHFIDYINFQELEGPMKLDIVNQYYPEAVREYINRNLSRYTYLSDEEKLITLIAAIVTNRVDVIDKLSEIDKARFKIHLRGYSNTSVASTVASNFNKDLWRKIYNIEASR